MTAIAKYPSPSPPPPFPLFFSSFLHISIVGLHWVYTGLVNCKFQYCKFQYCKFQYCNLHFRRARFDESFLTICRGSLYSTNSTVNERGDPRKDLIFAKAFRNNAKQKHYAFLLPLGQTCSKKTKQRFLFRSLSRGSRAGRPRLRRVATTPAITAAPSSQTAVAHLLAPGQQSAPRLAI